MLTAAVHGWACIENLKAKELRTAVLSLILYLLLLIFSICIQNKCSLKDVILKSRVKAFKNNYIIIVILFILI